MKRTFLAALAFIVVGTASYAHEYKVGSLEIDHPWMRPSSGKIAGGFLKITNKGTQTDRLIGGTFENADKVEIHETTMENNVAKMRPATGGIEIKPGETIELKPGSFHVMFMGMKQPTKDGEKMKGTLVFEKAGSLAVEYAVERQPSSTQMDHHH